MKLELDTAGDQRILTALRTGKHRWAAGLMVSSYSPSVYRVCRCAATSDEADELTNETYTKAFARFNEFRAAGSPRTWLLEIAHECCVRHVARLLPEGLPAPAIEKLHADTQVSVGLVRELFDYLDGPERGALGLYLCRSGSAEALATQLGVDGAGLDRYLLGALVRLAARIDASELVSLPADAAVEAVYPRLLESLRAVSWRVGDSLTRRLEVLSAAL